MDISKVPILILIFNRPDKVRTLITALEKVRPTTIYIAADGPRPHVPEDKENCAKARAIAQQVTWPCTIHTCFSEQNLGVDPAIERGIDWFFSHVEAGIILEDDCIPHPDFFVFVTEMLERYKDDKNILMISGNNFQTQQSSDLSSYYFSRYPNTWGWATWKRAWSHYDSALSAYPTFVKEGKITSLLTSPAEQRYWIRYFKSLYKGTRTSWDVKWIFSVWNQNGISITPHTNLVQNIGFGKDATHTFGSSDTQSVVAKPLGKIHHPNNFTINTKADRYLFETLYRPQLGKRITYYWGRLVHRPLLLSAIKRFLRLPSAK